jgi:hypothetical protein
MPAERLPKEHVNKRHLGGHYGHERTFASKGKLAML